MAALRRAVGACLRRRSRAAAPGPGGRKAGPPPGPSGRELIGRTVATALPLYLTMLASTAGGLVDTALLGRHATASLAAFALTMAVYTPATATVAGALRGVMPFVSAHDDDPDALLPVVRDGLWLAIATGLLGALAVAGVPLIGLASGVPRQTLSELGAFPYLMAASVLVAAVGNAATSTLVGLGRSRLVMRAGMTGTATAVVLSLILVNGVGPLAGLGPPGAGIAMLAAATVGATVAHAGLRRCAVLAGRPLGPGRPQVRAVIRLAGVGLPLAGTVLIKFAVLGVLAVAAARIDPVNAAAHSISVSLVGLMFAAAVAVGQATIPLLAPHVKAKDVRGVRAGVRAGVMTALGAVLLIGGVLAVLRVPVLSLFTHDLAAREQVRALLPLVLLVVVTDALQAVFGFGLVAIRDTVPSLLAFAVCYGLLALAAVPLAARGGLTALWLALLAANTLLVVGQAAFFHLRSGRLRRSGRPSTAPGRTPA
ncbi:MATE family efflux transporter [Streptomyces anulatus]|uniref:MATE family efflux transporter n=1 Tax=Streptomyces anulatus TaxID=1892 RepID=UPI0022534FF4|nr:MATE family efflux transporter [Streptomyces anulatus]MCX4485411.1 MATE family efflux transporter [Streptomyces anulatus]